MRAYSRVGYIIHVIVHFEGILKGRNKCELQMVVVRQVARKTNDRVIVTRDLILDVLEEIFACIQSNMIQIIIIGTRATSKDELIEFLCCKASSASVAIFSCKCT